MDSIPTRQRAHTSPPADPDAGEPSPAPQSARPTVPLRDRLTWGIDDLSALTGLSRRTLERERSAGRFPKPDLYVGKRPMWRPETIRRWIEAGSEYGGRSPGR